METPKHQCNTRVCTSPAGTSAAGWTAAFVVKLSIRTVRTVPPPEALDMGRDRPGLPLAPTAGLKPSADGIRSTWPFGLPKREEQPAQTSRRTGGVASSQVDPPRGGTGARVGRHRRLWDRSPHWSSSGRQPRLREGRLNGFPGALAEVRRHRTGGGRRRVSDAAPTGLQDARFVVQPAYPLSYNGAGEGWPPAPLRSPRSSRSRGGRGRGLRPPSPVPVRRDA